MAPEGVADGVALQAASVVGVAPRQGSCASGTALRGEKAAECIGRESRAGDTRVSVSVGRENHIAIIVGPETAARVRLQSSND